MVPRTLETTLRKAARKFPVVTVVGPRQAGKTTLCRATFPEKAYASLEAPDTREFAIHDPRGFLREHARGAILDEIQRAPALLSYLQQEVDARPERGRFVLTGSANFAVLESVGQSLAGRTAVLNLLPLGLEEVRRFPSPPRGLFDTLWKGSYPALYDRGLEPGEWYSSYVATYVERDVRQILNVGDLTAFQTFLRLCAGRSGQLVNLSGLGADAGIEHGTARAWLSVLEASFLVMRLPPFHSNLTKRLVKRPKLHFLDSGLLCYLLGVTRPEQLLSHPLRGAVFESWVVGEILKARLHRGLPPRVSFFRDRKGAEVDLVIEEGDELVAVETKSGQTVAEDFFRGLRSFASALAGRRRTRIRSVVVFGGDEPQRRTEATVLPWSRISDHEWG